MTAHGSRRILDLTRPLNAATEIYRSDNYHDPPLVISPWCDVVGQGFSVSRLEMGTQTGTHIDAPAHFLEGGATLEMLGAEDLIGPYFLVHASDLQESDSCRRTLAGYGQEPILLLAACPGPVSIPVAAMEALLSLGARLWAVLGTVAIEGREPLFFHRRLASAGVFLVEDLDESQAGEIRPGGELLVLPLRLEGVSGSPCRAVARL